MEIFTSTNGSHDVRPGFMEIYEAQLKHGLGMGSLEGYQLCFLFFSRIPLAILRAIYPFISFMNRIQQSGFDIHQRWY